MRVIRVRNAHEAVQRAAQLLPEITAKRNSRNGSVHQSVEPVTTVYSHPRERVIFWPQRDANPFFHLYESLWMLCGRNDVKGVSRYASQMAEYSDDGRTFHGAYGERWRLRWLDQLEVVADRLRVNSEDRRCVIQMWDTRLDLGHNGKDVPCNVTATVQVGGDHRLDLAVFCRSNDAIWGAYGANVVHFTTLQEYLSRKTGYEMGTFTQISVNWHVYERTAHLLRGIPTPSLTSARDPYSLGQVRPILMPSEGLDGEIKAIVDAADRGFPSNRRRWSDWGWNVLSVLKAHEEYKSNVAPRKFDSALDVLTSADVAQDCDWVVASREWIERRMKRWEAGGASPELQ